MADVTVLKTPAELALAAEWDEAKARLPGQPDLRARAFDRFAAQGLPHRRIEEWKYTDLRALMRDAKPLAPPPDAAALARAKNAGRLTGDVDARRIVFVDGAFVAELSDLAGLEQGVSIRSMAQALSSGDPLIDRHLGKVVAVDGDPALALNTAFMGDGALIHIAAGVSVGRPLHLMFVAAGDKPAAIFTRSLVVVEDGARAMIVESHEAAGAADYQVNVALDLVVGERAHVDHVKLIGEGDKALHVSTLMASVAGHARFKDFSFISGGAVTRNQLYVRFHGNDTVAAIGGINLLRGKQHADTTMLVEHDSLRCQSRELFKSVLDQESRGVFQGRIVVKPHAQQTDGKMMSQALLLSEDAEMDNKPELEIFADDVQCGHGATCGDLDEELLFYLRARGIPPAEAESLLIQAFVGEAAEAIEHARLRDLLMEQVVAWLEARGSGRHAQGL
jgi:Fe-S cluster assembly protein SufD